MKENFPNLAKEIDFQEVQEAQMSAHVINLQCQWKNKMEEGHVLQTL